MISRGAGEKPSGPYAEEMTGSGAWPETDESVFADRAQGLRTKLVELISASETWEGHRSATFNSANVWSGCGASNAGAKVEKSSQALSQHVEQLQTAISWCDEAASKVIGAKEKISTNVRSAQADIEELVRSAAVNDEDPTAAIRALVNSEYFENFYTVSRLAVGLGGEPSVPQTPFDEPDDVGTPAADEVTSESDDRVSMFTNRDGDVVSTGWSPPPARVGGSENSPELTHTPSRTGDLISAGWSPQAVGAPERSSAPAAVPARSGDVVSAGWTPQPPPSGAGAGVPPSRSISPGVPSPALSSPSVQASAPSASSGGLNSGGPGLSGGSSGGSSVVTGGASGGGATSSPISDSPSSISDQPSVDPTKGASGPSTGSGGHSSYQGPPIADRLSNIGPAMQPASAPMPAPSNPMPVEAPAASAAPPNPLTSSAAHAPVTPVAPPPTGGGGVPMAGGGPAMPPPPMPLGPPPTPSPAAPVAPASAAPPPVATSGSSAGSVVGAPAPVPVSPARAERDAIAASMRRQSTGDSVQVARRIAAALNAVESMDFGFFWATAVAKDGTILVANSYGIGYIPDGVKLPEGVKMVSADESIPIEERAKWATFPMLALHGWAQHHDVPLRAVVATAEQFDGFDPGASRVILKSEDIPERGDMAGRSRLEVIAPSAACRLDSVADATLGDLLPPASADTTAPADNSMMLWFDVMKPLMSTAADRGVAHLEAMVTYANHAQELALHKAQTAADAETQRAAIADWIYWQHVSVMSSDAIVVKQ